MAKLAQSLHNRKGKVFVGEKLGHDAQASSFNRMASSISAGWQA
jgi:hypothetical protein